MSVESFKKDIDGRIQKAIDNIKEAEKLPASYDKEWRIQSNHEKLSILKDIIFMMITHGI